MKRTRLTQAEQQYALEQESAIARTVDSFISKQSDAALRRVGRADLLQHARMTFCQAILSYKETGCTREAYAFSAVRNELRRYAGRVGKDLQRDMGSLPDHNGLDDDKPNLVPLVLARLSPSERAVIVLRYGLNGQGVHDKTTVARKIKHDRAWVFRREREALAKLNCLSLAELVAIAERRQEGSPCSEP